MSYFKVGHYYRYFGAVRDACAGVLRIFPGQGVDFGLSERQHGSLGKEDLLFCLSKKKESDGARVLFWNVSRQRYFVLNDECSHHWRKSLVLVEEV